MRREVERERVQREGERECGQWEGERKSAERGRERRKDIQGVRGGKVKACRGETERAEQREYSK